MDRILKKDTNSDISVRIDSKDPFGGYEVVSQDEFEKAKKQVFETHKNLLKKLAR